MERSRPMPPFTLITRGVKDPCSTNMILLLYFLFFSFSIDANVVEIFWFRYVLANRLQTFISKNAIWYLCQNASALMSALASFLVLVDLLKSFFSSVKGSSGGSTLTLFHVSFSNAAVKSRTWLCRLIMYPPIWHDNACWIVKLST